MFGSLFIIIHTCSKSMSCYILYLSCYIYIIILLYYLLLLLMYCIYIVVLHYYTTTIMQCCIISSYYVYALYTGIYHHVLYVMLSSNARKAVLHYMCAYITCYYTAGGFALHKIVGSKNNQNSVLVSVNFLIYYFYSIYFVLHFIHNSILQSSKLSYLYYIDYFNH